VKRLLEYLGIDAVNGTHGVPFHPVQRARCRKPDSGSLDLQRFVFEIVEGERSPQTPEDVDQVVGPGWTLPHRWVFAGQIFRGDVTDRWVIEHPAQRPAEPFDVLSTWTDEQIDVAGGPLEAVKAHGDASDEHVFDVLLVQSRQHRHHILEKHGTIVT
jgi:hypothetical protein